MTALDPIDRLTLAGHHVLDLLPIGVLVCTIEGSVELSNRAARDLLGDGAELGCGSCWDLLELAGGHLPVIDRARRAAAAGRVTSIESSASVRRSVDATLPVAVTVRALADDDRILVTVRQTADELRQAVRLRATEDRFERLATSVPAGILSSEFGMRADFANERATVIFGVPSEDLLGFGWLDRLHPDDARTAEEAVGELLTDGAERTLHARVASSTGVERRVRIHLAPAGTIGRDVGFVATIEDLTENHDLSQRLIVQALHDPLTGLPNRTALWEQLGVALVEGRHRPAVLFVDLDDFKHINDSLGTPRATTCSPWWRSDSAAAPARPTSSSGSGATSSCSCCATSPTGASSTRWPTASSQRSASRSPSVRPRPW